MDIKCPACRKLYTDIDFSLAGRKFGCECGHKFYLDEDPEKADLAPDETDDDEDGEVDLPTARPTSEIARNEDSNSSDSDSDASEAHEAGATALMEVSCPKCHKLYPDIDASLAGSKFGCECGHKFYLQADGRIRPATNVLASAVSDQAMKPSNQLPDELLEDKPPLRPKQPDPLVVRDLEDADTDVEQENGSRRKRRKEAAINPPPARRRVSQAGNFIVSWILNIILIGLLISLVYFGYQALTGRLELPFEIRLQLKEDKGEAVPEGSR